MEILLHYVDSPPVGFEEPDVFLSIVWDELRALQSRVHQFLGGYAYEQTSAQRSMLQLPEHLRFTERSVAATLDQLLGRH